MRKINKGAAIAGGILCFIAIVTIAIDFIQMLSYNAPAQYMIRNGIIQGLNILALLLLAVVLFRSKADIFGGIVCSINIVLALYAVFSHFRSVLMYLRVEETNPRLIITALFYVLANLLKAAAFLTMALQCFKKKPGKNVLCLVLALICALVVILTNILNVVMILGGGSLDGFYLTFSRHTSAVLRQFAKELIPGVFASVYLILAGAAFSRVKDGSAAANDPYAMYRQYQSAQYQVPQYQQPQYQQPQYQQPQYQAPQYQQPQYQAPQYQQPQYQQPQYQASQYQAPGETFQAASQVTAEQEQ